MENERPPPVTASIFEPARDTSEASHSVREAKTRFASDVEGDLGEAGRGDEVHADKAISRNSSDVPRFSFQSP